MAKVWKLSLVDLEVDDGFRKVRHEGDSMRDADRDGHASRID